MGGWMVDKGAGFPRRNSEGFLSWRRESSHTSIHIQPGNLLLSTVYFWSCMEIYLILSVLSY